jgi:DNA-binding NtrC family response regulator
LINILVMDDDIQLLRLFSKTLVKEGYRVLSARSVDEARTLLTEENFQVFVCDMNMGEDRGIDLLGEMQTRLKAANTLVLVLSADDIYFRDLRNMGYSLIIEKPVLPSSLINIIQRILTVETLSA